LYGRHESLSELPSLYIHHQCCTSTRKSEHTLERERYCTVARMPQTPADSPNSPWLPCYRLHKTSARKRTIGGTPQHTLCAQYGTHHHMRRHCCTAPPTLPLPAGSARSGTRSTSDESWVMVDKMTKSGAEEDASGAHDAGKDARVAEMLHDVRAPSCSRGQRMRAKGRVRELEGISPERKMLGEADEDDILVEILSWRCDICPVRWHQKLKRTCQRDFCSTSRRSVSNFVQCSSEAGILMVQCPERTVTRSRSGKILAPRPARRCAP